MLNLENFDLDLDDDFSSNIFSKVASNTKNEIDRNIDSEKSFFTSETVPGCESNHKLTESRSSRSFFDISVFKEPRENLKRSCIQDEKPQKKRLSNEGLLSRKFPGPAGLLPDKPFKEVSDLELLSEKPANEEEKDSVVYSQSSGSVFLDSCYQKLLSDFGLHESNNPLNKYTVEWVKKTALSKGLHGRKIPFLGLVVHSVNQGMPDPVLVLRDPTGEIHGSLHREVWADMGGKLKAGIALALRQVGVLITGVIRRQIYLNVTMNNILSLYTPTESESQVEIMTVNRSSKSDLLKSFEDWLARPSRTPPAKPPVTSPLFTTINDGNHPLTRREEMKNSKNKLEPPHAKKGSKGKEKKTEEVLADMGIVLTDVDFREEMSVPDSVGGLQQGEKIAVQGVLSQAESAIFEEVLSGIDLDEFEM